MQVIYTGDEAPKTITKSIFLAGPTRRDSDEVESWRQDAIQILKDKGFTGTVFVPEDANGEFKKDYDDQIEWEERYLNMADCILFWVPRDLTSDSNGYPKLPALTTNIEWGAWANSGKVVFGAPEEADKIRYLKCYANKYNVPTSETLTDTIESAMKMVGSGSERTDGEREVPLYIWNTESFQSWYKSQTNVNNRLDHARLLYNFRPGNKDFVFMWVLQVDMYINAEGRNKTNEFVLSRNDISSVLLYYCPKEANSILNYEVVLVAEYRSPVNNSIGFILELPGGSSPKKGDNPLIIASHEVKEETGFTIDPKRFRSQGARQLAGTLSSHKGHLFMAELSEDEINWFKSQDGSTYGNKEDTEITYVKVQPIHELIYENKVDWSTLGQILSALVF